ncbi:AlpA family transcriptional regulator [Escherichia coli]|nr:AlpA family transcriptional regulator [Escherichia coli]
MIQIVTREELENDKTIDRMIKEDECAWLTALGGSTDRYLKRKENFHEKYVLAHKQKVWRLYLRCWNG